LARQSYKEAGQSFFSKQLPSKTEYNQCFDKVRLVNAERIFPIWRLISSSPLTETLIVRVKIIFTAEKEIRHIVCDGKHEIK
jgi:hypothetical protein